MMYYAYERFTWRLLMLRVLYTRDDARHRHCWRNNSWRQAKQNCRVLSVSPGKFNPLTGTEQRTIIQQYGDWYTGRWWVGCYIWYSEEEPGRAAAPPSPLLAVPDVTTHTSTASVPTSYHLIWHYNCLCTLKG